MPGRRLRWWSQGIFGPDHLLQSCIKAIVDLACLTCWGRWRDWGRQQDQQAASAWVSFRAVGKGRGALCVQLDFTRTFKTMCNNINCVWSHFYKMLVVLKYHRRLTDKRTDVWSRDFMIWKVNFGLWAVAWAGLCNKGVWANYEQLLRPVFSLFQGQKKFWPRKSEKTGLKSCS